jgi:trans-aconitate 2-methyltransferase
MAWDPVQYLKFAGDRMRPAIDLLARVPLSAPRAIVDLGCGAGNVTRLLAERYPGAAITGIDNSAAMLERAQGEAAPGERIRWRLADLAHWAPADGEPPPDLVYSNAALHWLDDHPRLFPGLLAAVAVGGVLAVQMPNQFGAPSHTVLAELADAPRWRTLLAPALRGVPVAPLAAYYEWLVPQARAIDAWTTEYLHVLPAGDDGEHPVVAWTRGTALTPFLALLDAGRQRDFLDEYRARVGVAYPRREDGSVLFPFRRQFIVAVRRDRR